MFYAEIDSFYFILYADLGSVESSNEKDVTNIWIRADTFIDLPHDSELQVLPVVLLAVETQQDSAQLHRQPEGRHHVDVTERAQTARQLLHGRDALLRVLKTQHINH